MEILFTFTEAFFSKYLKGKMNDNLLNGPGKEFPEVAFDFQEAFLSIINI